MLKRRFCSADHELKYAEQLRTIALERLRQNREAQEAVTARQLV